MSWIIRIIFGSTYLEGTTNPAAVDAKAPSPPEALAIPRDVPTGSAKEAEIVFVSKCILPKRLVTPDRFSSIWPNGFISHPETHSREFCLGSWTLIWADIRGLFCSLGGRCRHPHSPELVYNIVVEADITHSLG